MWEYFENYINYNKTYTKTIFLCMLNFTKLMTLCPGAYFPSQWQDGIHEIVQGNDDKVN